MVAAKVVRSPPAWVTVIVVEHLPGGDVMAVVRALIPGQPARDGVPLYAIRGESEAECRGCCEDWLASVVGRLPQLIAEQMRTRRGVA